MSEASSSLLDSLELRDIGVGVGIPHRRTVLERRADISIIEFTFDRKRAIFEISVEEVYYRISFITDITDV